MAKVSISVSKKILADVSRGIYRTPANAIKELVSNAFDACATWVNITTNSPYFDIFTCEDNGNGMSIEHFKRILERIGSSTKRADKAQFIDCNEIRRPIIGKIGIGLLAVSQICDEFTIISKEKGKEEKFEAHIKLLQFEEEDDAYNNGEKSIDLGECELNSIYASEEEIPISYTKIIMHPLREGFQNGLKKEYKEPTIRGKESTSSATDFVDLLKLLDKGISRNLRLKSFSNYDLMVWELGLLSPTKYITQDVLQEQNVIFPSYDFISEDIKRLNEYKFRLFVDGMEIYKPLLFLKGNGIEKENDDFKIYKLEPFNQEIAGERLKFHGYIYSQRVKIKPEELQGILIRIKDVAIGSYDKSILKYPREEGPIFSMISGEIFIEEGLENALNIDRNSFNETHPHYQEIQRYIHLFVRKHVVNDIRTRSSKRQKTKKQNQVNENLAIISEKIRSKWKVNFILETKEEEQTQPYMFDEKENRLVFFNKSKRWSSSEKEKFLQMKSIIAFTLIKQLRDKGVNEDDIILNMVLGKNE